MNEKEINKYLLTILPFTLNLSNNIKNINTPI